MRGEEDQMDAQAQCQQDLELAPLATQPTHSPFTPYPTTRLCIPSPAAALPFGNHPRLVGGFITITTTITITSIIVTART